MHTEGSVPGRVGHDTLAKSSVTGELVRDSIMKGEGPAS